MRARWWMGLGAAVLLAVGLVVLPGLPASPLPAPCAAAQTTASASTAGASFTPVAPRRVLDTRTGPGPTGPIAAGSPITLDLSAAVPAGATAVVLNLTGVDASEPDYIEVWPAGTPAPTASNINLVPGRAMANLATVALGSGASAGKVSILTNLGTVNVVADLAGYYTPGTTGAGYTPRTPLRALDTRTAIGGNQGAVGAGKSIAVDLSSIVPPTATSVVATLTAADVTASTYVTAWPTGVAQPTASNLNLVPGGITANLVTVSTGAGEKVSLYNAFGSTDLVLDVAGYFAPGTGGLFVPLSPTRVLDTRDGTGGTRGPVGAQSTIRVGVGSAVPAAGNAAVVNVTGVSPSASTFVTAWPDGVPRPTASNVNLGPGDVTPALASIRLGSGAFDLFNNNGTIDLLADVSGYYLPRPACGAASPPAASYGSAPAAGASSAAVAPTPNGAAGRAGGGSQSEIAQRNGAPNS